MKTTTAIHIMPIVLVLASVAFLAMHHMPLCITSFVMALLFWLSLLSDYLKK